MTDPGSTPLGQPLTLGKLLLERGLITAEQLRDALAEHARGLTSKEASPAAFENILVTRGYVSDQQLAKLFAEQNAGPVDLSKLPPPAAAPAPAEALPPPAAKPPPAEPGPPTKLGKYELVKELGRGGRGTVYEAMDTQLNRKVALKLMLNPNLDAKEAALEEDRFLREAQLSAKLKHPNIVTVHEGGSLEGRRYLSMEMIEGQSMAAWRKQKKIPLRQQIAVLRDVSLAVHAAHEAGILHRDLNPRNVLIDGKEKPYVTDFGLAKTPGTPAYMSPEQAQGLDPVDGRTDVYSLGCMLYEILADRTPHQGESPAEIPAKVVKDPIPLPSEIVEAGAALAFDPAVEKICMKALAKNDMERYATAKLFADDLTRWLEGKEVKGAAPRASKKSLKKIYIGAAAAVVATVAAGAAWLLTRPSKGEPTREQELERARLATEMAEKLRKKVPPPTPSGPLGADDPWKKAVSLLSMADAARNAVWGTWILRDDGLLSDRAKNARFEIPYLPPEEYDLRVSFTRLSGADEVTVILPRGGRAILWRMGFAGNTAFVLFPSSASEKKTAQVTSPRCLENDRACVALIQVRKSGIKTFLDGQPLCEMKEDAPEADPSWKMPRGGTLGLGSHESSTLFRHVELLEVTGKGKPAGVDPPPLLKAQTVGSIPLKPGIVAEYCYGTDFEAPALRKIDPFVAYDWGEGAAWTGGPVDGFSVRWSGYLQVPRAGPYAFSLKSDDGARLFLDDVQVTANGSAQAEAPSAIVALEEGFHKIVVEYFDAAWLASVYLLGSEGENAPSTVISSKSFHHDPSAFKPLQPSKTRPAILEGHANSVTRLAVSPQRSLLASAGEDRKVRIWDLGKRKGLALFSGHTLGVLALAFSPDGLRLASGGWDRKIKLWNLESESEMRTMEGHAAPVETLAWSPAGSVLASGSYDRTVKLWNPSTGKEIRTLAGHAGAVSCVAFSPNGKTLASAGGDRAIRIWDVSEGRELFRLATHADSVEALAFSPDGKTLASGSRDGTIKLWETATGKELRTLPGHGREVNDLAFAPDGRTLASAGNDAMVRLWDVGAGKQIRLFAGHSGAVTSLAWDAEGATLVSGGFDATIRIWTPGTHDP